MAQIISLPGYSRSSLSKSIGNRVLVKHAALAHIERARKLLMKLEGNDKRHLWMLEDLAETLRQSCPK